MRTLLLFDGLGASCAELITQLRTLYARPENRAYFTVVCAAVETALDHVGSTGQQEQLPAGLPLRAWLHAPVAPAAVPADSISAGVCTHALQLCGLQPTGLLATTARREVVGALGLSLGLQAAIVAALDVRRPTPSSTCAPGPSGWSSSPWSGPSRWPGRTPSTRSCCAATCTVGPRRAGPRRWPR